MNKRTKINNQEKEPVRDKDNASSGENFGNFQIVFSWSSRGQ